MSMLKEAHMFKGIDFFIYLNHHCKCIKFTENVECSVIKSSCSACKQNPYIQIKCGIIPNETSFHYSVQTMM